MAIVVIQYSHIYHQSSLYFADALPQKSVWNQFHEVPSCANTAYKVIAW